MNTITKTHSIFGQGTLVSENATTITVRFSVGEKTFLKAKVKFLEDGSAKENKVSNGSKKRAKDAIELAAFNSLSPLEQMKQFILWVNGARFGERHSASFQLFVDKYNVITRKAEEVGNTFVVEVANTIYKTMRESDKQAFVLAQFAIENNLSF